MPTIRELLQSDLRIPRLEQRVVLAEISTFTPAQLISRDDYSLTSSQYQQYLAWIARLELGEPLAYILGYREFYSRRFKVTPATLIPRPETELLVDEVLKRAAVASKIVDLGSGSGCIAITLKLERPDLTVLAVDRSLAALKIAALNATALGAELSMLASDWYTNLAQEKFDIIVSNPPYIEGADQHLLALSYEPQAALTDFADGLSCLQQIVAGSFAALNPGGYLLVEHGFSQAQSVRAMFKQRGMLNVVTIKDYANLDRITIGLRA